MVLVCKMIQFVNQANWATKLGDNSNSKKTLFLNKLFDFEKLKTSKLFL